MSTDTNNHDMQVEKAEVSIEDDGKILDGSGDSDMADITAEKECGQVEVPVETERRSLASHHRVHHHHHHHTDTDIYDNGKKSSSSFQSAQDAEGSDANSASQDAITNNNIGIIEDSEVSSTDLEETPMKKRVPLAAHHRSHHHSGSHHHHSSSHRHRRSSRRAQFQDRPSGDYTQSVSVRKENEGQGSTILIDKEEFARLHNELMNESAYREENSTNEDAGTMKSGLTGGNNSVEEQNIKTSDEGIPSTQSDSTTKTDAPRLASAIVAAREANPRETRKASSIKSSGSHSRKKKANVRNIIVRILIAVAVFLVGVICILLFMRSHGQSTMTPKAEDVEIVMPKEEIPDEVETVEDEGKTITYKGQKYRWNDNLTTILILGTDRTVEQQESGMTMAGRNGQADTILLGVIDNTNKKISFININRDTFVPVAEYASDGDYAGEKKMQICLSYAYGKDNETSCRYTAEAVSKYLYGMPIDYYARLSYDAIPVLNDSVGGVTLTVLEDLSPTDASLTAGSTVTLFGNQALTYVRWRDMSIVETNENRISRQKQYLYAFMNRTVECVRADMTLPLGLYANAKPYMTSNITASQLTYLTSKVLEYGIEGDAIHSIPGKSVIGSGDHIEFYPDQTALYEQVLSTFYIKVE